MIDETKERQTFDKWFSEDYRYPRIIAMDGVQYMFPSAERAWETWLKKAELGIPNGTDRPK